MAGPSASSPVPVTEGNRSFGGGKKSGNGRLVWVSSEPTPEIIAELSRWFPETIHFPEEELSGEMSSWAASVMVARSFGRRVAPEVVAREMRWRAGLKGEVTAYGLENHFYLIRFSDSGEKDLVLHRPWVVNGQVLAVQPWRPGFLPMEESIHSTLVWVRLPRLPIEYWGEMALRRLLGAVSDFILVYECTATRKHLGFARACVRVDFRQPLRPGTLILGPEGEFWQRFVYEHLDGLCLGYGCVHSPENLCPVNRARPRQGVRLGGRSLWRVPTALGWGPGYLQSAGGSPLSGRR